MGYTESDLELVRKAILDLATGKRAVSVRLGDVTVEFGRADMDKLRKLEAHIISEIQTAAGRKHFILTTTSKGL